MLFAKEVIAAALETLSKSTFIESDDKVVAIIRAMLVDGRSFDDLSVEIKELSMALMVDATSYNELLELIAEMATDNDPRLSASLRAIIKERSQFIK